MVESLANILAVQLIRHTLPPRRLAGTFPSRKLNQVVDYIMGNLDNSLTLDQMVESSRKRPARRWRDSTPFTRLVAWALLWSLISC
jgi:hypothetical protein